MRVYAGNDPLTGKEIRLKATAKTAEHAQAELARLLEQASTGQQPRRSAPDSSGPENGCRRCGELCGLWWADLDLELGSVHVAHNYLVRGGQRIRKDTKTHQDRRLAIGQVTCDVLVAHRQRAEETLAAVGLSLADRAYVFSNLDLS